MATKDDGGTGRAPMNAADQIEHLSREARGAMVANALRTCPDLGCDEAVVRHLHVLGMTVGQIDRELAALIDEARAAAMTRMGLSSEEQAALANHKQPEKQMIQIDHDALLAELQAHVAADKLVKGSYWENGKGCAVGCTLHSFAIIGKREPQYGNHSLYDDFLGPGGHMLGRLEDCIFEGMANEDAREWPERFLRSSLGTIKRGSTLQFVGWTFLHWLLTDETVNPGISNPLVRDAIRQCADVLVPLTKGDPVDESPAESAASAAWSAAESAASAARSAARSAAWSAASAAESAASAARSEAWSASWSAAWSAANAARGAAWSAASAARSAAESAASAAWSEANAGSAAYKRMSDKLVELMDAA